MEQLSHLKKYVITAMCVTLCVVLPLVFHMIPNAGRLMSPMHIPVLLCGLICGWPYGLVCGAVGPILSNLTTGMPPFALLPPMIVELMAYGLITGLLSRYVRTKRLYADLYISLIAAMLIGRILAGLTRAFIFTSGGYSFALWAASYFISTFPGIVVHLILIPIIVVGLEKARLIPRRYPK